MKYLLEAAPAACSLPTRAYYLLTTMASSRRPVPRLPNERYLHKLSPVCLVLTLDYRLLLTLAGVAAVAGGGRERWRRGGRWRFRKALKHRDRGVSPAAECAQGAPLHVPALASSSARSWSREMSGVASPRRSREFGRVIEGQR